MSLNKALAFAKVQIEKTQNEFFRKTFDFTKDGVVATMDGKYKLHSVSGDGSHDADFFLSLHQGVYALVKDAEMKGYAQDRNLVRAKFKVDIAKFVPEVAEAVAYMDKKNSQQAS
jgi:hypothetical protein